MDNWLLALADSPWLLPALFALVLGDAFLVVVPSETAVVALGALSAATGSPSLWLVIPVATVGAITGDSLCYLIGRKAGHDRWKWQREGRVAVAASKVRETVLSRPAVLIFTARYVPFARIAVNLTAGASGLPYRRFLPLSAAACVGWASYNVAVGAFFGTLMSETPLLAVIVSVLVAVSLGVTIDFVTTRLARRREKRDAAKAEAAANPPAQ